MSTVWNTSLYHGTETEIANTEIFYAKIRDSRTLYLTNAFQKFFVSELGIYTSVISFPEDCNFVAQACFHMPVDGIVTNVGLPALKPLP